MALADMRSQAVRRSPEEMLEHLAGFELELRFSAGIWYFSPPSSRFHAKYRPDLPIEARLDAAGRLAGAGLAGLEAHYPNEINEDNVGLWRDFCAQTGIRLITVIPLLFWDERFEWGSLSNPIEQHRRAAIERTSRALQLNAELDTEFAVVWPGIDGYENPLGIDFPAMRDRFAAGLAEAMDAVPGVRIAFEPKPYEPRGRILFGTTPEGVLLGRDVERRLRAGRNRALLDDGHALCCMNPEVGHVLMGYEDLPYAFSWPLSEGRLAHSHWNSQPLGNYDQDLNVGVVSPEQIEAGLYVLKMHGYRGYFGIDINPVRMPVDTALQISMDALRAANDRVNAFDHEAILFAREHPERARGWIEAHLLRARAPDPGRLAPLPRPLEEAMADQALLGIDVGTGGCKALLVDTGGAVLADATTEYPLSTPRPLWAEQDPEQWWAAAAASIRAVLGRARVAPGDVAAVGLTGQMHGLVLLDGAGEVLRPAILWNDQRCAAECDAIHRRAGRQRVLAIAGKPALPGFTAPKILWVAAHEPAVFAAAARILLPKDYVRYRMTGRLLSDVADASGTALFDVGARRWSPELLEALEVPAAWLPEVTESPVASAAVSAAGAREAGLPEGMPVVAGAGDQAAEAVGCGIVDDGAVSVTLGTSGVVFAATAAPRHDPDGRLHAYCHAVPGAWHVMGVMLSAGGSLRWYRDTIGGAGYDELIEAGAGVSPGCEGLTFLPYLTGERCPHPDPGARGAFVGLTLRHGRAHLTRAVLEGVTFGLKDALELARGLGIQVNKVRVSGGGARSGLWLQMMADVFGAEVATVNVTQGAAYGAALLAGAGTGVWPDVRAAARSAVRETAVTHPGPEAAAYAEPYTRYRALYPALAPHF